MHTFSETAAGVPAFLAKLWRLVEDPETNNLICWSKDGRSFIIQNQAQFARELLPLNYKHNNMASFIRQLNMYGFHKITSIDNGGLKFDRDEMEFTHPCFKRNCPYLLEHIKRKIASTKSIDEKSALKPEAVTKVLQDVKAMRGRQDSLDSRFSVMKQENEALWREIASLRQKHAKQQQIVNKLIQFLITIVQPQRNMTSVKRHTHLMINDIPDKIKMRKTSESETESGPVIHELGEELLDEVSVGEPELMAPHSPFVRNTTPATPDYDVAHSPHNVERPSSNADMVSQTLDLSNLSAEDSGQYSNAAASTSVINDGLIQTVNNDGSKIFYHITEVPDAQPKEENMGPVSYNEDNVLTTPMVREEMARNKLLKEKNRQRRAKVVSSSNNMMQNVAVKEKTSAKDHQLIQIKSEHDSSINPSIFLNVYQNNHDSAEPEHVSTNFGDDSLQPYSNITENYFIDSTTASANIASPPQNSFLTNNSSDLYNPNNFINTDIPADIFEDNSPTIVDENNSNIGENNNFKEQKLQIGRGNINCDKSSTYSAGSTTGNGGSQPSTSAAAVIALSNNSNDRNNINRQKAVPTSSSPSILKDDKFGSMALTKYRNQQEKTHDEVSGELGTVQDELECLKDLLRSDAYCLDNNTLLGMPLNEINFIQNQKPKTFKKKTNETFSPTTEEDILNKLFNDADILGPYDLHLNNDGSDNDKKGSELTAYQPIYDLSDIINDQNELDDDANMPTTSTSQTQQQQEQEFNISVLNTPYHE